MEWFRRVVVVVVVVVVAVRKTGGDRDGLAAI